MHLDAEYVSLLVSEISDHSLRNNKKNITVEFASDKFQKRQKDVDCQQLLKATFFTHTVTPV